MRPLGCRRGRLLVSSNGLRFDNPEYLPLSRALWSVTIPVTTAVRTASSRLSRDVSIMSALGTQFASM